MDKFWRLGSYQSAGVRVTVYVEVSRVRIYGALPNGTPDEVVQARALRLAVEERRALEQRFGHPVYIDPNVMEANVAIIVAQITPKAEADMAPANVSVAA